MSASGSRRPAQRWYARWRGYAWRVRRCDSRSPTSQRRWPPAKTWAARPSLHFPKRPDRGQRSGAVGGGERGQAKIVHGGPEPETVFMDDITPHGDHDLVLARDAHVAGRIFRRARNLHMLTHKAAGKIAHHHGFIQLNVDGKRVRVKDRGLYQHHGGHRSMRAEKATQVRGDPTFCGLQWVGRSAAITVQHVERNLRIKHRHRHLLER